MHLDEGTIHAWLDGALDAEEAARVEQHVAECAACASAVAEARGLVAGASRILSALDDVPSGVLPHSATFADSRRGRSIGSLWRVLHMTPTRAAAAAILIVAAGTTLIMRNQPNGSPRAIRQVSFPHDSARAMVFAAPKAQVRALPVPPTVASADSAAVFGTGSGSGNAASSKRYGPRRGIGAESPAPVAAAPPVATLATDASAPLGKALDKRMALADVVLDSMRRARRDSAIVDSASRRLEAVVATSVAASTPRPLRSAGVAGVAAPSAVTRVEMRAAALPYAVNYAGCYSVFGQGGLPSLLSLDYTRLGAEPKVAALADQRTGRLGISSIGEANQRKRENGWWEPIEGGRRGVRISIDDRAPIVFTALGDSLVSTPDSAARTPAVTLRRVNCPIR